jgi:DNA (cytosine-5)-methyltransferase 1
MRFVSLFSGIEAASLAWAPLGWECVAVAEVEPFPCEVLKVRHHAVPNLGDVRYINEDVIRALGRIDVVIGGFPCQDVSIAGKRRGFKNADGSSTRSGLFWDAMRLVHWSALHGGCRWVVLENVPGLFNSHEGRDFAGVVGALAGTRFSPPRGGWRNAGCAVGPAGMVEWSVLDAQYWGLAQRRKRVFLVADLGDWSHRPPVLLERAGMLGNPPSREKAGQGVAGGAEGGTRGSGITGPLDNRENAGGAGWGTDWMIDGGLTVADPLKADDGFTYTHEGRNFRTRNVVSYALGSHAVADSRPGSANGSDISEELAYTIQEGRVQSVAMSLNAKGGAGRMDGESETFIVPPLRASDRTAAADGNWTEADGLVISQPQLWSIMPQRAGTDYKARAVDVAQPLMGSGPVSGNQGGDVITHTLKADGFDASEDGTGRGVPLVFDPTQVTSVLNYSNPQPGDPCHPLAATAHAPTLAGGSGVRRLTVTECERLMGVPDGYTQVTFRGKPAADGNRYKALGNSFAVPVVRWIGERIQLVSKGK